MQFLSVLAESRQAARNLLQLGMLLLGWCLATFGQEATIVGDRHLPSAFGPREFPLGAKLLLGEQKFRLTQLDVTILSQRVKQMRIKL